MFASLWLGAAAPVRRKGMLPTHQSVSGTLVLFDRAGVSAYADYMPRGKKQAVNIAGYDFRSVKDATNYLSSTLNALPINTRLNEPHDAFLRDLVSMHPRAEEKTRGEISHFSIGPDGYGHRCFYLHRTGGTKTDFSFHKCLKGEKGDDLVLGAMRTAIMDQIQSFRDSQLNAGSVVRCPFHDEIILDFGNSHVDHKPPRTFYVLVHEWLESMSISLSDVKISESKDNQTFREMTDPVQLNSWREFHRSNAQLRLTSRLGNLSDSKIVKLGL